MVDNGAISLGGGGGSGGIDQLTGDVVAGPGTGSQVASLADVGTAGTVGDATHYPVVTTDAKGRVTGMVATAVPAGVNPATTVTGPDAYGAAAVVGTGTTYARADHNHGLPAAPADIPLSTVTTANDMIVATSSGAVTRVPGPITTDVNFLIGNSGSGTIGWTNVPTGVHTLTFGFHLGLGYGLYWNQPTVAANINASSGNTGLLYSAGVNTSGTNLHAFSSGSVGTDNLVSVISQGGSNGALATAPLPSAAPATALVLGTAWLNPNAWDVTLEVFLAITANTSLVISLGVGTTTTPTQVAIVTGTTLTGIVPVTIKVPAGYYALLSDSGTGTVTIMGQIEFSG